MKPLERFLDMIAARTRLADWPLIVKFGITPALSLLVLFVFTLMGVSALHRARDATQEIVRSDLRDAFRLAQMDHEFERTNGDLFRLLTAKAANPKGTNVSEGAAAIQRAFTDIGHGLTALRASGIGKPNRARIDTAIQQLSEYAQAVDVVTTMLDVNFETAVSMLPPFQKNAAMVTATFRDVSQSGVAQSSRHAQLVSDQVEAAKDRLTWLSVMAVIVIAATAFMLGIATIKSIFKIADATARLAGAEYDIDIRALRRSDELGAVVTALEIFREAAIAKNRTDADKAHIEAEQKIAVAKVADGLRQLALGDLTVRLDRSIPESYDRLRNDFNTATEALQDAIIRFTGSVENISAGSTEIRSASQDLSRRTERQAVALGETAATMDQITSTVRETALRAQEVSTAITHAEGNANEGGRIVGEAVVAMRAVEQSSQEIAQVVDLIDGIAFQTNLLALNAGVEAARAGEAGMGFAVIANEVRALSQRSADAAKIIKALVQNSSQHVGAGVKLVGQTGQALGMIVAKVAEVTSLAQQISVTTASQAGSLQQINTAVSEMNKGTQQNAAMVDQATAAATNLTSEVGQLADLVTRFDVGSVWAAPAPPAISLRRA